MDFCNILMNSKKDELALGYNNEELYKISLNNYNSIIITGSTGSGKSILLDQILLQFINNYTSLELNLALIDTSGVELNIYANSNYAYLSALNDNDKSLVILSRILKIIDERSKLLQRENVNSINEYNLISDEPLPYIVVAIDDDKFLLRNPDIEKVLTTIIKDSKNLNIMLILATSDIFNKFFKEDKNTLASLLISFDYTNIEETKLNNIEDSNNLAIGEFIVKVGNSTSTYHNFNFDDELIKEIVER